VAASIQGQSGHTIEKQYGLGKVLGQWLSIIGAIKANAMAGKYRPEMAIIAKMPVLYVDMNAGRGWNEEVNCIGSPLLFVEQASKHSFDKTVHFIESDEKSVTLLGERLYEVLRDSSQELPNIWCGNHSDILPGILIQCDKRYGLIYHDPNGLPSFELLESLSKHPNMRFVDILIRISGTNYKRIRNGLNGFGTKRGYPTLVNKYPNLKDQLKTINKKEWLIRDIIDPDPSQWTFLLGTNWTDYPSWEAQGFYKTSSSKGAAILNRVSYTIPELSNYDKV
jgi:hypothetical protein